MCNRIQREGRSVAQMLIKSQVPTDETLSYARPTKLSLRINSIYGRCRRHTPLAAVPLRFRPRSVCGNHSLTTTKKYERLLRRSSATSHLSSGISICILLVLRGTHACIISLSRDRSFNRQAGIARTPQPQQHHHDGFAPASCHPHTSHRRRSPCRVC